MRHASEIGGQRNGEAGSLKNRPSSFVIADVSPVLNAHASAKDRRLARIVLVHNLGGGRARVGRSEHFGGGQEVSTAAEFYCRVIQPFLIECPDARSGRIESC